MRSLNARWRRFRSSLSPDVAPVLARAPRGSNTVQLGRFQTIRSEASAILQEMADRDQQGASFEVASPPAIEKRIHIIRGRQVMLDEDLADLYGVETKRLIEQVKRNLERFPDDFMFQLADEEAAAFRSPNRNKNNRARGRRLKP